MSFTFYGCGCIVYVGIFIFRKIFIKKCPINHYYSYKEPDIMKKLYTAAALLSLAMLYAGDSSLQPAKAADWKSESRITEKDGVFVSGAYNRVISRTMLAVDPAKKYRVSGEFRQTAGKDAKIHFGVAPYSADKKFIGPLNSIIYGKTFNTLKKAVKAGDTKIEIAPQSDWIARNHFRVAFNAQKDGSDLPNFDISKGAPVKRSFNVDAGTIIITLSKPVEKDYPAGTNVRLHTGGGEFLSCAGEALALSNDWKSFSGEITGESSGHTRKNFRKNTKFAAIMFRVYAPDRVNSKIQFRNLKLEEVK